MVAKARIIAAMSQQDTDSIPFGRSLSMAFLDELATNTLTLIAWINGEWSKINNRKRLAEQAHLIGREQDMPNYCSIDLSNQREPWIKSTALAQKSYYDGLSRTVAES